MSTISLENENISRISGRKSLMYNKFLPKPILKERYFELWFAYLQSFVIVKRVSMVLLQYTAFRFIS